MNLAGLTVNASFAVSTTPGSYTLQCSGSIAIGAAGSFAVGTSKAIPYPQACTFIIDFTGNGTADAFSTNNSTGQLNIFCTEPTHRYVRLTADKAIGQTVMAVDTDVTQDIWAAGSSVLIGNIKTQAWEIYAIAGGGIAAGTITLSSALTVAHGTGDYLVLLTRNVRILGSTYAYSGMLAGLTAGAVYASISGSGMGVNYSNGMTIGGVLMGFGTAENYSNSITNDGCVFAGNTHTTLECAGITNTNCLFASDGLGLVFTYGALNTGCTWTAVGYGIDRCYGVTNVGCAFVGNNLSENLSGGLINVGCSFVGNYTAQNKCAGIRNTDCTCTSNTSNIVGCSFVENSNCLLGSVGNEVLDYSGAYVPACSAVTSVDDRQVAGAYKAWTPGGIVLSEGTIVPSGFTKSFNHACASAVYVNFRQEEYWIAPGETLSVTGQIKIADDHSAWPPRLEIVQDDQDPLVSAAYSALASSEIPIADGTETGWQSVSVSYANSGALAKKVFIRCSAKRANGYVYEVFTINRAAASGGTVVYDESTGILAVPGAFP